MATYEERLIDQGLQLDALPALERLAANPNLRNRTLRRFERDEPPQYQSSTESDEDDLLYHPAMGSSDELFPQKYKHLLDAPLDEKERQTAAYQLHTVKKAYDAGERYENEARQEQGRLRKAYFSGTLKAETREFVGAGRAGRERCRVIVRRNIRTRWQKLGVWNRDWGIPGRPSAQPNDDTSEWKWPWQHGQYAAEWNHDRAAVAANAQHPISRAVHLRQGLHRDEHIPVPPRGHLEPDDSAPQAESFLISRPWFLFLVECREEWQRMMRLPPQICYQGAMYQTVREWWKQRGDWRDDWEVFESDLPVPGWKWRHESPEPEPCDLATLDIEDADFSPSEIDALEAIPPPTPRPVARFNSNWRQAHDWNPSLPLFNFIRDSSPSPEEIDEEDIDEQHQEPLGEGAVSVQEPNTDKSSLQHERRNATGSSQIRFPPPRRSARLAAKQASNPFPVPASETKAARRLPARPPPGGKSKRRGRPKKQKEPSGPSGPGGPSTTSEVSAPMSRRRGRKRKAETAAAEAEACAGREETARQKRRRGRPNKNRA